MGKSLVVQFEITGRDAGRLHSFYRDLFGWQLHDTPGGHSAGYQRTSAEETGIPGAVGPTRSGPNMDRAQDWDGGSGQLTVYIEVEDIEEAVSQAEMLGGKVVSPVHEVSGTPLKVAFIADPEGHVLGVSQGLPIALKQAGYTS
jgi:predicted enzyme related to lactoylglutathione lyase